MNMIRYGQAAQVQVAPAASMNTLPSLIDRAKRALENARDSAEILEALELNRVAYDAVKSAGRLARAKQAHDTVLAEVYRAQADILMTEARAKMRLAEEYDAAQDRGEVQGQGGDRVSKVPDGNVAPTAADIGLDRKMIYEARQIRDAEAANPGVTQRVLEDIVSRGEEPTKAKLNREIQSKPAPTKVMDPKALWLWGRLKDFERDGIITADTAYLLSEMTEPMRDDVRRLAPLVSSFLNGLEQHA